jgi:hypothetical protein
MRNRTGDTEKQKRIYRISLLLRRKTSEFLIEYMGQEWGIKRRQGFNYIRLAKKEWAYHYAKCLGVPCRVYYIAELRDLRDQALEQNDLKLAFDIAKEEAKVMGAYLPGVGLPSFLFRKAVPLAVKKCQRCVSRTSGI